MENENKIEKDDFVFRVLSKKMNEVDASLNALLDKKNEIFLSKNSLFDKKEYDVMIKGFDSVIKEHTNIKIKLEKVIGRKATLLKNINVDVYKNQFIFEGIEYLSENDTRFCMNCGQEYQMFSYSSSYFCSDSCFEEFEDIPINDHSGEEFRKKIYMSYKKALLNKFNKELLMLSEKLFIVEEKIKEIQKNREEVKTIFDQKNNAKYIVHILQKFKKDVVLYDDVIEYPHVNEFGFLFIKLMKDSKVIDVYFNLKEIKFFTIEGYKS